MSGMKLIMENWRRFQEQEEEEPFDPDPESEYEDITPVQESEQEEEVEAEPEEPKSMGVQELLAKLKDRRGKDDEEQGGS